MATLNDLQAAYIAYLGYVPERIQNWTGDVTYMDVQSVYAAAGIPVPSTVTPETTRGIQVTADQISQFLTGAGIDPSAYDPDALAAEVNSGSRTQQEVMAQLILENADAFPSSLVDSVSGTSTTSGGTFTAGEITDVPVVGVGGTTVPDGARLVVVTNPEGSDFTRLYYAVYEWQGVQLAYEIGDVNRLREVFGGEQAFNTVNTYSQPAFDGQDFTLVGSVDQILGSSESLGSQIEREVRALGLEDLPSWLAGSPQALALVAQATAQEWSSGRLWVELSDTQAFADRFGGAIDVYLQGGVTIGQAVDSLLSDENALRDAIRTFQPSGFEVTPQYLQGLLASGWSPLAAAQVLEQADIFRSDPDAFLQANAILEASGLPSLNEVEFINALNGYGPPETVEALNTAAAGIALSEAGLDDLDLDLLMEVVDTSDRLLTVDSFKTLAQELAFNTVRFGHELDFEKLGITREDLFAAAFGEESPSGKSSGEVINLMARFQRDRQVAGEGLGGPSSFQDQRGRLRLQGLTGL